MTDQTRPMDTKRIAEIRARVEAATPGPWTTKTLHTTLADADFIAHSRADVPYLLDLVASLTAERDALRDRYEPLRSWADGAEIDIRDLADQRDDLRDELAALRAVIEEARARIANRKFGDDGTRIWIEDYMDDLGRLLDRGLKGAGDDLFTSYLDKLAIVLGRGHEEEGARFGDMPPVVRAWVAGQSTPAGALLNALDRGLKGAGE